MTIFESYGPSSANGFQRPHLGHTQMSTRLSWTISPAEFCGDGPRLYDLYEIQKWLVKRRHIFKVPTMRFLMRKFIVNHVPRLELLEAIHRLVFLTQDAAVLSNPGASKFCTWSPHFDRFAMAHNFVELVRLDLKDPIPFSWRAFRWLHHTIGSRLLFGWWHRSRKLSRCK